MAEAKKVETTSAETPTGKTNGMAVTALVLGIISLITFWAIWVSIITGILAIIFGAVGVNLAKTIGAGKGMAMAGLVMGIIGVILAILWVLVITAWLAAIFGGAGWGIQKMLETFSQYTPASSY